MVEWGRRAAVAGFATAVVTLGSYGYSLLVVPGGVEPLPVWMRLPQVLMLLAGAGIPVLSGWLLLDERGSRRQVGAAVLGAFGLLTAVHLPAVLVTFPFGVGAAAVAHSLLLAAFMLGGAVAAGFAIAALAIDPAVRWRAPWGSARSGVRVVLGAAIVLSAVGLVAPTTRYAVEGLPGGLAPEVGWALVGGFDLSSIGWLSVHLVLPVVGLVAVGIAAAGLWPLRAVLGAGAVVAAEGVVSVVSTPIDTAAAALLWGQPGGLTGWYWVHVAVVAVLIATLLVAWRAASQRREELPVDAGFG